MKFIQIYWTSPNIEEARNVTKILLEKKLIACANIIPEIESHFFWEGKIESSHEVKVIFKTKDPLFEDVLQVILQNTQYKVPEVLKVKIKGGNPAYLKWIEEITL